MKDTGIEDIVLIPPRKGSCKECADFHAPETPHNRDSLYYQMKFRQKNGRYPTWADAIAHCDKETQAQWIEELKKRGITVKADE